MIFAIDADVLGILQRAEHLAQIGDLGRLPWVITDEVWYEVTDRAAARGAYPATVDEMRRFMVAVAGTPTPCPQRRSPSRDCRRRPSRKTRVSSR